MRWDAFSVLARSREDGMIANSTIPLIVEPDAAAHVAELGMQAQFEQMLEHARQTMPGLRSIRVTLQPAYDLGQPCVLIEPEREDPHLDRDPTDLEWARWQDDAFPPEVCQHFVLLSNYGWPDAR
jgi:hypothetical protein